MKKLVLVAIILLVPFTSFALDTMSDADLGDMTAQAGVTIALSVNIVSTAADSAWGDTDASTTGGAAWIVMDGSETELTQNIQGFINIDVMNAEQVATELGNLTYSDGSTFTYSTAVVINLDLDIENEGGETQQIALNETPDSTTLPTADIDETKTLGLMYSASSDQTITGTVAIMAHD